MRVSNQFDFFEPRIKKVKKPPINQSSQQKRNIPMESTNKFSSYNLPSQKFQTDQQSTAGSLQNGEITEFYFQKLIHIEYQLCLVVFLNLFLIAVSSMISFPELKQFDVMTEKGCLYFCLICVIIQCIFFNEKGLLLGFRTVTVLQLEKEQKILYEKSTIFSTKKIFEYFAQCLIMLIQPYPFFLSIAIQTTNSYDLTDFQLPVNDILTCFSVLRIYVFIRAGLILTPYQNTRSNRLCKMYGCKANFSFSLKCMFKDNPLVLIGIFFTISSIIFAFQIYLVERRAAYLSNDPKGMSNNFTNALWLVLMTITTVGYGDYFPHTAIGRIIILIVAIWGTFIVSMMVVVVSNTLKMQKNEKRTSIIINKLELRKQIEKQAQKFVGYFMLTKHHQKIQSILQKKLKKTQNLSQRKKLQQQIKITHKKVQNFNSLCKNGEKNFSKLRREVKGSEDIDDIEDEVSSHFLHVNSDIEILNKNQQKIISFIHEFLEYNGRNKKQDEKNQSEANKSVVLDDDDDSQEQDQVNIQSEDCQIVENQPQESLVTKQEKK